MLSWESVIVNAIRNREIMIVTYRHVSDDEVTRREMELFDISRGRRTPNAERSLWGWCLHHNSMERKHLAGLIRVEGTGRHFDPKIRESTFSATPAYEVPRDW